MSALIETASGAELEALKAQHALLLAEYRRLRFWDQMNAYLAISEALVAVAAAIVPLTGLVPPAKRGWRQFHRRVRRRGPGTDQSKRKTRLPTFLPTTVSHMLSKLPG